MRSSLLGAMRAVFVRELLLFWRRRTEVANVLVFFVIVTTLFPLAVGPERLELAHIAPGVLWVAALLATTLSLTQLFIIDYTEGSLDQLLLSPYPLTALVFAKLAAHWVLTGLPLALLSPLLAVQMALPDKAMPTLVLSLLLGTPVLTLIGAIPAALTLGVRGGGVLVSLLVLPLYTPVLIFGAEAVAAAAGQEFAATAHLSLLAAFLVLALAFAPLACASALRVSLD
ncbi:MAG: heme exporter protein CcmB [Gammaproteobacteria bacterium]|nr:heme exporter protein CcmB [Gammaproteobacteria bacterium]